MNVLIAPNAFKGSLSAGQVCELIGNVCRSTPNVVVRQLPLADGGDGTLDVLAQIVPNSQIVTLQVCGPFPDTKVNSRYLWHESTKEAFVEMSLASGLALLKGQRGNPEETTTYGTGELCLDAIKRGAKILRIAIGGSATNDAAIGALSALGWKFLDSDGNPVPGIGKSLIKLKTCVPSPLILPRVQILCDVNNPLHGSNGAAYVYAPQKGADPAMVERLDSGLRNFAEIASRQLHREINVPGAGAAGGFGGGAVLGLNASLVSGFTTVAEMAGLDHQIDWADVVITGEGRIDNQTLQGKVVGDVLRRCVLKLKRIVIVAGSAEPGLELPGTAQLLELAHGEEEVIYAIANAGKVLYEEFYAYWRSK